jgi:hypothetical protein
MAIHLGRREFIAGLGGAVAGAAIGSAAAWIYAARAYKVRALQLKILRLQADAAANEIAWFIREIAGQAAWLTQQLPWTEPPPPPTPGFMSWANDPVRDQARGDVLRLLRAVPAITEISYLDSNGIEQLKLSRVAPDVVTQTDFSQDPKFTEAMAKKAYYGPVFLRRQSEPYLTMSFAGARREYGVIVVVVGIKLVWDVIQMMGVGQNGVAYIVDAQDWVIAHSNPMLVVREIDSRSTGRSVERKFSDAARLHEARVERSGAKLTHDGNGREILTVHAAVGSSELGWMLLAEVPLEEAGMLAQ